MAFPVQPIYPTALTSPPASQASGIPVCLGGLMLNGTDASGVSWVLDDAAMGDWDGTAGVKLTLTPRPRSAGSSASESFDAHRVLVLSGMIEAPAPSLLTSAMSQLNSAASLAQTWLAVNESGLIRHMLVQRDDKVLWKRNGQYAAEFSVQVAAKDPLKYGDLTTVTTSLPSSTGGRTYPATYPITYTGVTNSGVLQITNNGDTQAPVWLRVDGPIPAGGWSVTHIGKARTLQFSTSLALGSGEFVTVDMGSREVLAQGQSARSGWVTSRGWFDLDPGVNSIAFSAQNYSASAVLTVQTMSAWS